MWKMRLLKSIEFYRDGVKEPWRASLLLRNDGRQFIELTAPDIDTEKVLLAALTKGDYQLMLDIMSRAVQPDEIKMQVERGWE